MLLAYEEVCAVRKAQVYRLACGDGSENLYKWSGKKAGNGLLVEVNSFVKDKETRKLVGRWLPCPNWNVESALRKALESKA